MNDIDLKSMCHYSSDNFVGVKFDNDKINVYFPLGYNIPEDNNECRLSILNLLKTISLSNSIIDNDDYYSSNDGIKNELPINAFIWLINDYLLNGLYKDKEKIFKRGQTGKINWKKTLNTNFYISGKNIVYLNPYVEKKVFEDNIITDIHSYCIGISIKYIGWLFGQFNIPSTNINEANINYCISIINNEMIHTFDDQKKLLLTNLKKVLEHCGGDYKISLSDYGVNRYEHIWEYMVNDLFGNQDVEKYFPSSSWHILDWNPFKISKLRPDTILTVNKNIYVLDSKYYKFGITANKNHLPATESIQKQITYGEYIDNNYDYDNIYNAFIIPYNKLDNQFNFNENIKYIGFAESNWKNNKQNNFYERIALILVDTKYVIDCYFRYQQAETLNLIKSIQQIRNTF